MTPNARFEDFLRDIEPSRTTKKHASSAHKSMREFLSTHEDFGEVYERSFLSGSYKRDTAIRPRARQGGVERPDVDIIVQTNHELSDSPADIVDRCTLR